MTITKSDRQIDIILDRYMDGWMVERYIHTYIDRQTDR